MKKDATEGKRVLVDFPLYWLSTRTHFKQEEKSQVKVGCPSSGYSYFLQFPAPGLTKNLRRLNPSFII